MGVRRARSGDVLGIAPRCGPDLDAEPRLGLHWPPKTLQSPQTQPCPCAGSAGTSGSRWRSRLAHIWCPKPLPGLSHSHGPGVAMRATRTFQGPRDDGDTDLIPVGPPPGTGKGAAPVRWHSLAGPRQQPRALPRSAALCRTLPCVPVLSRGRAPLSRPTDEAEAGRPALGETFLWVPRHRWQDRGPRDGADQAPCRISASGAAGRRGQGSRGGGEELDWLPQEPAGAMEK